jgi:hypothetical protein
LWIQARRNNFYYILNKLGSMAIGILFALVTLFLKLQSKSFIKFGKDNDELKAIVYHMQNIYWLMFIYFCMHVMDEMIELFSTINQMEKGALGLFFEMNHSIRRVSYCFVIL